MLYFILFVLLFLIALGFVAAVRLEQVELMLKRENRRRENAEREKKHLESMLSDREESIKWLNVNAAIRDDQIARMKAMLRERKKRTPNLP